ncbi:unnamed protein product [Parajaminaea phylloscopi]
MSPSAIASGPLDARRGADAQHRQAPSSELGSRSGSLPALTSTLDADSTSPSRMPAATARPQAGARGATHLRVPLLNAEDLNRFEQTVSDTNIVGPFQALSPSALKGIQDRVSQEVGRRKGRFALRDIVEEAMQTVEQGEVLAERQTAAQNECYTGNENLSCYPTSNTTVVQGSWGRFVWNRNFPDFTNDGGYVDIYLFHQDSDTLLSTWSSISNEQGRISFQPQDSWWQGRAAADDLAAGQNLSWPFYFAITSSGKGLAAGTSRLATWHAIQTAVPVQVALSRSSASASSASAISSASLLAATASGSVLSAASASLASLSRQSASASLASSISSALVSSLRSDGLTGTETARGTATSTLANGLTITAYATAQANGGSLNDAGGGGSAIPRWAIALIVVLGFLALVALLVLAYFLMRWARRRGYVAPGGRAGKNSEAGLVAAGSYGSRSPMMREAASEAAFSEVDETGVLAASASAANASGAGKEPSPFSTDEASRMAAAFRAALRKPGFGQSGVAAARDTTGTDAASGSSTSAGLTPSSGENTSGAEPGQALLRDELASEGRDLRRVEDRRHADFHA